MNARVELPVPAHALPQRSPRELLIMARRGLEEAAAMRPDGLRYATAHLAALRAGAAVLAARATSKPGVRRSQPTSVWALLGHVAPELSDWATFFAAGSTKRAAAEAGIPRVVSATEADSLIRSARDWIRIVEVNLGLNVDRSAAGGEPSGDSSKGSSASGSPVGGKPKAPSEGSSDLQGGAA